MRRTVAAALLCCLLLVTAPALRAQVRERRASKPDATAPEAQQAQPTPTPEEVGEGDVVRVNTTLVTVPVSITDRQGRYIPDLRKDDFRLYEEGVEQEIAYFAATEKPFTVVLMLDTSTSIWSKLGRIKDAAQAFVEQLRPEDQVMVVSFARGFTVQCEATLDREKIRKAIQGTGRGLSTRLYDAMEKLMQNHLNRIQGRKAVVLFTDGVDAKSNDATFESTLRTAEELDALIYPILYDTYDASNDNGASSTQTGSRLPGILGKIPITIGGGGSSGGGNGSSRADYDRGERYLRELAGLTGGRLYEASRDLSQLRAAFSYIAEELRRQYTLGYYPRQGAQPGERRRISVRVDQPELSVRSRDSYIYKPSAPDPNNKQQQAEEQGGAPVLKKKQFNRDGQDVQDKE
ncbi:MAG TPA: VWA domain-containing protein [Pyrinomonadaceae bacterium]|nr:VWA domain-containing protein [Pyrinomonadaceae bacterium]